MLQQIYGGTTLTYNDVDNSGTLSAGDRINGTANGTITLSAEAAYDVMMRVNTVKAANLAGPGWNFYGDGLARASNSPFWQNNAYGSITMKQGVKPSDALMDIFNNRSRYSFDCASAVALVLQKARLDTVGSEDFDRIYANGNFHIAGWQDPGAVSPLSMMTTARQFNADGTITLGGRSRRVLAGENRPFDPAQGDRLIPGSVYFYEKPGDNTTAGQGWNVVYLGNDANGNARFWRTGGTVSTPLNANSGYYQSSGPFAGEYLSSNITNPNGAVLAAQDSNHSMTLG